VFIVAAVIAAAFTVRAAEASPPVVTAASVPSDVVTASVWGPGAALIGPARVGVEVMLAAYRRPGSPHIEREPMTTEYFSSLDAEITFPADSETADAIRRIARHEVTAYYHYCARTMREALGWGLGDAHEWTALPDHGYTQRPAGSEAQPGDIVVWPFTYGRSNSQHIGIAVGTRHGTMLLSNLSGRICLSELKPGYRAYYR